ncbi:MAG: cold shock domain-containing protein [Acidobacteriia bacterium]|nr:cold shock domain-containing protein [Terriglobia bacterium]
MKIPVDIRFRNVDPPAQAEEWVREMVIGLEKFHTRIMRCRVMVELPHLHHAQGNPYHVRIDLTVPGKEIVIKHQPTLYSALRQTDTIEESKSREVAAGHKDLYVALSDAFRVACRRLQDHVRLRRGQTKSHEPPPQGRVSKLFPDRGFGFLETSDGREIYFHERSVLHEGFGRLEVGSAVTFVEEEGENGPQASTVRLTGKRRASAGKSAGHSVRA